jgi:chemotaxis protein methyltransferase CheR
MPLTEIAELVRRETGITMEGKDLALRLALRRAAPGLDPEGFMRAVSDPLRGRGLMARLIEEVTIQETVFARDPGQLKAIPWDTLRRQALGAGAAAIRVWSAGCATGEEPYTLALLAAEAFAPAAPQVDVLGTDISGAAIAVARTGRYRGRTLQSLDAGLRDRYLERQPDGSYLVRESVRRLVRFRQHNLASAPAPPLGEAGFDLIVCRNVLIYFEAPVSLRAVEMFEQSLRPGGRLLLGAADALLRTVRIGHDGHARGTRSPAGPTASRRPLGREPAPPHAQLLAAALATAGKGDSAGALRQVALLLKRTPLDAEAQFAYGLISLEAGEPATAAVAFRRALYADPAFAVAAFTLGCALDALGDGNGAKRAYEQALRTLDAAGHRHDLLLEQVAIGDIAAACRTRLTSQTQLRSGRPRQ